MSMHELTFDAVAEAQPGPRWAARWRRSWPAYRAWFVARGGAEGPSRAEGEAALSRHMPELAGLHRRLAGLAGDDDLAARFLSTWRPPAYLGGCSAAALTVDGQTRLVRNYDLSPELNEGLLLRTEWTGAPVMGMIEFLWGLSDGMNAAGLCLALTFGGRRDVAPGFGVTTILRYVLETCSTVAQALAVLRRVPSHMAYNVVLADRRGATACAELVPGGGARIVRPAIAANHQHGPEAPDAPGFTRTYARRAHLERLLRGAVAPDALGAAFLAAPLYQTRYGAGFGTLFTAVSDPARRGLTLRWPDQAWDQTLAGFAEGRRTIRYGARGAALAPLDDAERHAPPLDALAAMLPYLAPVAGRGLRRWIEHARAAEPDWPAFGRLFAGSTR